MNRTRIYFVPTRADVNNLKVGDIALDCFGRWCEVVAINYHGVDINGRCFVGFSTRMSATSSVSHSYKEGQLVRTVDVTGAHTSAQLDEIERRMAGEQA